MAAIEYDLFGDESRDFNLTIIWYDQFGDQVDLTDYGAIFQVNYQNGNRVARVTDSDNIVIYEPDDVGGEPDDDKGRIDVNVPGSNFHPGTVGKCRYELVVYPDSADSSAQPISLMKGNFIIRAKEADLE